MIHSFLNIQSLFQTIEFSGITVIRYQSPLYFANANFFVKEVYRLSQAKPQQIRKQKRKGLDNNRRHFDSVYANSTTDLVCNGGFQGIATISNSITSIRDIDTTSGSDNILTINDVPYQGDSQPGLLRCPISHIILDFSGVSFIDTGGCKILKQLILDYEEVGIQVFLAEVSDEAWEVFIATEVIPTYQNHMFLTVDDAVLAARTQKTDSQSECPQNLSAYV